MLSLTSVVVMLLGLLVTGAGAALWREPTGLNLSLFTLAAVVFLGILAIAYGFAPTMFRLREDAVEVQRSWARPVRIPFTAINGVAATPIHLGWALKVPPGGNSGLFGIYGRFRKQPLGTYMLYGTRARGGVVLDTADGSVVLTPDHPEAFIERLRQSLSAAER